MSKSSESRSQSKQGKRGVNRRKFLQGSALAGAGLLASRMAWAQTSPATTSTAKLRVAAIGIGGKGPSGVAGLAKAGAEIVALCDVDQHMIDKLADKYPDAKHYIDFREMFDKQKDIDAVIISTPDHSHAVAAMTAMKLGKHVYCEKPLTHDIWEARQLADAAKKYKVATQMGNQGHASDFNRRQVEWIQSGMVGAIKEVHCWTDRPARYWKQGMTERPPEKPVPDGLNWELWLNTASQRPYADGYHPFAWRGWWDFGTGALGDMGCHIVDPAYWALKLINPISVDAQTEGNTDESGPTKSIVVHEFAERDGRPPLKLFWYEGGKPDESLMKGAKPDDNGSLFIGESGTIMAGYQKDPVLLDPKEELKVVIPEKSIPSSPGHHEEFVQACLGGPPAGSNFGYSGPLTETILLGNVAIRAGKKIEWDGEKLRVTNDEDANKYIKREYQNGWKL